MIILSFWYPPKIFGAGYNVRIFSGTPAWLWGTSHKHVVYSTVIE